MTHWKNLQLSIASAPGLLISVINTDLNCDGSIGPDSFTALLESWGQKRAIAFEHSPFPRSLASVSRVGLTAQLLPNGDAL